MTDALSENRERCRLECKGCGNKYYPSSGSEELCTLCKTADLLNRVTRRLEEAVDESLNFDNRIAACINTLKDQAKAVDNLAKLMSDRSVEEDDITVTNLSPALIRTCLAGTFLTLSGVTGELVNLRADMKPKEDDDED